MTGIAPSGAQDQLNALVGAGVSSGTYYLALCTADPSQATTVAALQEVTTSGYARVAVTFGSPTNAYPSVIANSAIISFGPFTANMALAAQWLAMVTSSSGTGGALKYTWTLDSPEQVNATQYINIAAGAITISQS